MEVDPVSLLIFAVASAIAGFLAGLGYSAFINERKKQKEQVTDFDLDKAIEESEPEQKEVENEQENG
jgi:hypothetical protein